MEVPSLRNTAEISNVSMQYMKAEIFFYPPITVNMGFPRDASGKEFTYQCRRHGFDTRVRKIPWRRAWQSTPVFLPGESRKVEKPSGLQSMGLQRAGRERSDLAYNTVMPPLGAVSEGLWVNSDLGATFKPCKNYLTSLDSGPEGCLLPSLLGVRRYRLACC